ncbi:MULTISPECIES: riboflavin synthase [Halorhodospira]|uniref:riboflavin synthase n=1 Tax=Halorhodospira TaxID=85108 RepID=UPI001EE83457|nr:MULTISPECIES: riboflavin synthase [Halorhodospira]MCG5526743.1 riboflavin synthase [Halorhodospira halophila]MCG5533797.1 riboflavin synthase [Halorhodospira sp. 9621]MCG5539135.1 riboflavin synthase [Halorhodospira sp. 9622]MCG5541761.1 riboflavin synthase [Halorhodospira sp. M39old]MCG5542920.1 riboflavin synthase [Halorhodospira sp. 9628]
MFTGIVETCGRVAAIEQSGDGRILRIDAPDLGLAECRVGDSIAVDGVCLTATGIEDGQFRADVSDETLRCTTLGGLRSGARVNLERAVTPTTPLGGHLVTGHVDGVGEVVERAPAGGSERWRFRVPEGLARYVAVKGSIAVAGVSLTINTVAGRDFEVNLIPHTLAATNLGERRAGDPVNIEVDLVARYVERLLSAGSDGTGDGSGGGLTLEQLRQAGFGNG